MRFLIIGGGSIGKRHIKNLQALGFSDIICLKRKRDNDFEKEFQVRTIQSVEELGFLTIDGVFVCTPTSLHLQGIEIAQKLNAAIFMEKPLVHTIGDLQKAKAILQHYNNVFFLGFMLRYHPLVRKVKKIMDDHELGNVFSARLEFGSFLPFWHSWEDHRISYASVKDLGGGVINTISHELDLIQYFFGNPESVTCVAGNFKKLDIEVEEIAEAVFEYGDKLISLHLDYLQKDYDRNIRILLDEGSISWNWHENKIVVKKYGGAVAEYKIEEGFAVNQLYLDELKDFIALVQHSQLAHPLDFRHAEANTRLILDMHKSAAIGAKVTV